MCLTFQATQPLNLSKALEFSKPGPWPAAGFPGNNQLWAHSMETPGALQRWPRQHTQAEELGWAIQHFRHSALQALSTSQSECSKEEPWLIHVEVGQKTAKFCKAIILQKKIILKKKRETARENSTRESACCDMQARQRPRVRTDPPAPTDDTHISWLCPPPGRPWSPGRSRQRGSCPEQASAAACGRQLRLAGPAGRGHRWF